MPKQDRGDQKEDKRMEGLKNKVVVIAEKYADLVEERIDSAEALTGEDLKDIYAGIQMLGHITATLERFSRMELPTITAEL